MEPYRRHCVSLFRRLLAHSHIIQTPTRRFPSSTASFSSSNSSNEPAKEENEIKQVAVRSWLPQNTGLMVPKPLSEVNKGRDWSDYRMPLPGKFGMEVSRVLGGGVVPGSMVLVGGDPGVGKSTLLLKIAAVLAEGSESPKPSPVVYISGEESIEQIANRANRMQITTENLLLYSSTDVEDIFEKVPLLNPRALIIDSIQTLYLGRVTGCAGNVRQLKECTSALLRFAKERNVTVFLIGHVTKSGTIAGPRTLEHMVDVILYMEGEKYSSYRLLRSLKNRCGSTDELGVFKMSETGLQGVTNSSEMFLEDQNFKSVVPVGHATGVILDGSRAFVIQVQALCTTDVLGIKAGRTIIQADGIKAKRVILLASVLQKQALLKLEKHMIFLNVVCGIKLSEPAGDLAVAAAICSSILGRRIPNDIAFIGEIGLSGELRLVPRMDKRVLEAENIGYRRCVVPKSAEKLLADLNTDIEVLGCMNLKDMIDVIFRSEVRRRLASYVICKREGI